mgnify:FL=1
MAMPPDPLLSEPASSVKAGTSQNHVSLENHPNTIVSEQAAPKT